MKNLNTIILAVLIGACPVINGMDRVAGFGAWAWSGIKTGAHTVAHSAYKAPAGALHWLIANKGKVLTVALLVAGAVVAAKAAPDRYARVKATIGNHMTPVADRIEALYSRAKNRVMRVQQNDSQATVVTSVVVPGAGVGELVNNVLVDRADASVLRNRFLDRIKAGQTQDVFDCMIKSELVPAIKDGHLSGDQELFDAVAAARIGSNQGGDYDNTRYWLASLTK